MGFVEKAGNDFSTCLELEPHYVNCHGYMGEVEYKRGNTERAVEMLPEARLNLNVSGSLSPSEVYVVFDRYGREVAALVALGQPGLEGALVRAWLDAMEAPGRYDPAGLKLYEDWQKLDDSYAAKYFGLLLFGAYDRMKADPFIDISNIWLPPFAAFRNTEHFKRVIREFGYDTYWRANGFPQQCRAVGSDDFECDTEY